MPTRSTYQPPSPVSQRKIYFHGNIRILAESSSTPSEQKEHQHNKKQAVLCMYIRTYTQIQVGKDA